jgi:ABC-type antimicrobial peptide transport system permease subunit
MLFGVGPNNPFTIAGALVAVILVALAATLIPACRAASIDTMKALRAE